MRTKLALLLAFARQPELLILDEPSEGLDPVSIEELLQSLVSAAADGTAVFFSSHQIAEVERVAEQVCILDQGNLVADLSLEDMRQEYRRITAGFANEPSPERFRIQGVQQMHAKGRQITLLATENAESIVQLVRSMERVSVEVVPITLREVFLETVRASA
ncbi:MAG: AAA family ATPase [Acidobacteriaceae bacterium]|nr:AAA family ATPase [Acidobacteriaceae bacterium]